MAKTNEKPSQPAAAPVSSASASPAAAGVAPSSPRPARPWRMPTERPGTEQTPSCNPNYRAPKK